MNTNFKLNLSFDFKKNERFYELLEQGLNTREALRKIHRENKKKKAHYRSLVSR